MFWISDIDFAIANNDYLGPTAEAIIQLYNRLLP
jgi:hypothetical protein